MSVPLEGMFIKSRYLVQRHIATGGMAAVFLGWDYRVERPVAIKVLRQLEEASEHELARFRREARSAALLDDPHVVQVYDFFEENGCCFLVMEYVAGINLKRYLRDRGALPADEAFALGEQICAALEATHSQGFIHRDIKPQNVLLDGQGLAKLTDFGIVHLMRERMTTTGSVLGTADYIAPEQARGEALTPASDLYAVGVMLYEMLTGRLLFTGRTPLAIATQHATAPVVPPRCFVPGLSPYIEAVVLRALHKRPERRYQTAARMRLALRLAREAAARTDDRTDERMGERGAEDSAPRQAHAREERTRAERDAERGARAARIAALADAVTAQATALKCHGDDPPNAKAPPSPAAQPALDEPVAPAPRVAACDAEPLPSVVQAAKPSPDSDTPTTALCWSRLGLTALAALALIALLLLGVWPHAHVVLGGLLLR